MYNQPVITNTYKVFRNRFILPEVPSSNCERSQSSDSCNFEISRVRKFEKHFVVCPLVLMRMNVHPSAALAGLGWLFQESRLVHTSPVLYFYHQHAHQQACHDVRLAGGGKASKGCDHCDSASQVHMQWTKEANYDDLVSILRKRIRLFSMFAEHSWCRTLLVP